MMRHDVMTDSVGAVYVTAERRYLLYELCDRLRLERRMIRWSMDLRCYVLIVRRDQDKHALRQILKKNDKGVIKSCSKKRRRRIQKAQ
ncbi:hypothetical protein D3C74_109740 [compost metagenome]